MCESFDIFEKFLENLLPAKINKRNHGKGGVTTTLWVDHWFEVTVRHIILNL